jgi:hypothetical protein
VRACAAEWAAFYKRDFHSGRAAVDGRGNRVSAAKDNEIVMFGFHTRFIAVAPAPYKRIESRFGRAYGHQWQKDRTRFERIVEAEKPFDPSRTRIICDTLA